MSLGTAPSSWFQMLMTSLWSIKSIIRNDALKHFFRNLEILEYFFSPAPLIFIQFNLKLTFSQEISFFSYMSLKNFAVKCSAVGCYQSHRLSGFKITYCLNVYSCFILVVYIINPDSRLFCH